MTCSTPLVLLVATVFVSSTVAMDWCDPCKIELLCQCYEDGKPPVQEPAENVVAQIAYTTPEELICDVCIFGISNSCGCNLTLARPSECGYDRDSYFIERVPECDGDNYIAYKDPFTGFIKRVYVFVYEAGVASAYQCIERPADCEETSEPLGCHSAVMWNAHTDCRSDGFECAIEKSLQCLELLEIPVVPVEQCPWPECD